MSRLRRLLDAARGRNQRRGDQDTEVSGCDTDTLQAPPPLPLLPAERRPITPPANLTASSADDLVAALGTFARLPPELRQHILVAAFGDRTLHSDLRLAPRGQGPNKSAYSQAISEHGGGHAPLSWSRAVMNEDVSAPAKDMAWEWCWYGCVCHRLIPSGSPMEHRLLARGVSPYMWPHRDGCLRGEAMMCQLWPVGSSATRLEGQHTATCDAAVGALGWLRTCRQAYIEGAEVLYGTNTFLIESRDLLDALLGRPDSDPLPRNGSRQLLVSHRLADIRSLELRLDVLLPSLSPDDEKNKMRQLPHLAGLKNSFPNLCSLVISFSDSLYNDRGVRPMGRLPEIDRLLLQPLALVVASFTPQLEKHVVVELPSNVFVDLKGLGLKEEQRGDQWGDGRGTWLQYPIGDSFFYYIKQGVESDLYWDHNGNPRSAWANLAHSRRTCCGG
ncbi:hypothetical protein KJ359_011710 [Pestalotiopsis sp. 9143b]|nr:hypothetical protein KJ359_011710 [Pestalotiopsis sp. 9143b]